MNYQLAQPNKRQTLIIALIMFIAVLLAIILFFVIVLVGGKKSGPVAAGEASPGETRERLETAVTVYREVVEEPATYLTAGGDGGGDSAGGAGGAGVDVSGGDIRYALTDMNGDCVPEMLLAPWGPELNPVSVILLGEDGKAVTATPDGDWSLQQGAPSAGGIRMAVHESKTNQGIYQLEGMAMSPVSSMQLIVLDGTTLRKEGAPVDDDPMSGDDGDMELLGADAWHPLDDATSIDSILDVDWCAGAGDDAGDAGSINADGGPNPTPGRSGGSGGSGASGDFGDSGSSGDSGDADDSGAGSGSSGSVNVLTGTVRVFQTDAEMTSELGMNRPNPGTETGPHTVLVLDSPTVLHGQHADIGHHPDGVSREVSVVGIPSGNDGEHVTLRFPKSACMFASDTSIPNATCS